MQIIPIEAAGDMVSHFFSGKVHVGPDRVIRFAMRFSDREAMETAIEQLIALVDAMDEDPDLEPNGDDGDWSVSETNMGDGARDRYCLEDDEPGGDDEPDWEGEPWLGSLDSVIDQGVAWGAAGWGAGQEAAQ